jgi:hypothetical protein
MAPQLPDTVIVNIKNALDDFKRHAREGNEFDFFAREILHSIVNCLDSKDLAHWQLQQFVAEIEFGEDLRNDGVLIKDPHADAVMALGLAMLREIDQLHLYDENGHLPYEYDDPYVEGFSDLLLTRINDDQ